MNNKPSERTGVIEKAYVRVEKRMFVRVKASEGNRGEIVAEGQRGEDRGAEAGKETPLPVGENNVPEKMNMHIAIP